MTRRRGALTSLCALTSLFAIACSRIEERTVVHAPFAQAELQVQGEQVRGEQVEGNSSKPADAQDAAVARARTLPEHFSIEKSSVTEVSGLAVSKKNAGWIWSHEDSGNPAQLVAIDPRGMPRFRYVLQRARNFDWEALEIAVCPKDQASYLIIGDVGRNMAKLGQAGPRFCVVPEPRIAALELQSSRKRSKLPLATSSASVEWLIRYADLSEDDYPDVEAVYFDTRAGRLGLITKESNGKSKLWSITPPSDWTKPAELEATKVAKLRLKGSKRERMVTGASFDAANQRLVLTSYGRLLVLPAPSLATPAPEKLPKLETTHALKLPKLNQIESITLLSSARALIASEGKPARFQVISVPPAEPATSQSRSPGSTPKKRAEDQRPPK